MEGSKSWILGEGMRADLGESWNRFRLLNTLFENVDSKFYSEICLTWRAKLLCSSLIGPVSLCQKVAFSRFFFSLPRTCPPWREEGGHKCMVAVVGVAGSINLSFPASISSQYWMTSNAESADIPAVITKGCRETQLIAASPA